MFAEDVSPVLETELEVVLAEPTPLRLLGNTVNTVLEIEPITTGKTVIMVFSVFTKDG